MNQPSTAPPDTTPSPTPSRDEQPLAFRIVRGGLAVAAGSYFNVVFGFLANLILTRLLAPEDFGIFALGMFFFTLLNLRARFPGGYGFAQVSETTGELMGSLLALDLALAGVTVLLMGALGPVLTALGYSPHLAGVILALALIGIFDAVTGTASAALDKELHFGQTSLVTAVIFPLSYLPAIWLAMNGAGYWSLVAQNATNALLLVAGIWWLARRKVPHLFQLRWRWDAVVAKRLLRFGGTVGLAALAGMLVGQFDNFLVGSLVSVAALGFYDRAYRMAQWPSLLVTAVVTRAAFYTYARLQNDPVRLTRTVTMTFWLIAILGLPLALGVFIAAPDLIAWLYGARYLPSAVYLRFLVVYAVIQPLLGDAGMLFVAVGKPRLTVVKSAVEAGTLMIVGTPLTLLFGAIGTCVAVGVTYLVSLGLTYFYVRRIVSLSLVESLGLPLLAAAGTLALYWGLSRAVDFNGLPLEVRTLCKLALAAVGYLGLLTALQPRTMIERTQYVWRLAWRRGA